MSIENFLNSNALDHYYWRWFQNARQEEPKQTAHFSIVLTRKKNNEGMFSMKTKIKSASSLGGGIITAIMASICCIGPVIFGVLGISAVGFLMKFEQYRPVFIVLAILLLATGAYFTYRKKPAAECATDTFCANSKSDRINKIVFWISAVLVLSAIFAPTLMSWF